MSDAPDQREDRGPDRTRHAIGVDPASEGIPEPGRRLGDFLLVREVGRGSMGIVYEAIQEPLQRRVALKVLPLTVHLQQQTLQRFLREAAVLAELDHPHIVPIYATGSDRGVYFYAMPFLEGSTLDKALRAQRMSVAAACAAVASVAEALHVAHEKGIVHRDVKPGNLIFDGAGRLLVADFGLARQDKAGTITESGALVGTPMYMSPEQVSGTRAEVDRRSDVYSLGATLYEMVTGQPPFDAENVQSILRLISEQEPRAPRKVDRAIPKDVETIVRKAIEKSPEKRYPTALAFAEDLRRYLAGHPIQARPSGILERGIKAARRQRVPVLAGAAVAIALSVAGFFYFRGERDRRDAEFRTTLSDARVQFFTGNFAAAEDLYSKACTMRADRVDGFLGRAAMRAELGAHADAVRDYDEVLSREPEHYDALVGRGRARFRCGDAKGAEDDLRRANALAPDRAPGYAALADLRKATDPAKALPLYKKALEIEPDDDNALREYGLAYEQLGELSLATQFVYAATQANSKNEENQKAWRRLLEKEDSRAIAVEVSSKAAPVADLLLGMGKSALSAVGGEIDSLRSEIAEKSAQTLSIAGSLAKGVRDSLLVGGEADANGGKVDREELDEAIERTPSNARALVDRALLAIAERRYERAESDLVSARDLDPASADAELALALLYLRSEDARFLRPEDAVACARAAIKKGGESPPALLILAESLLEAGHPAEAQKEIDRILALPSADAEKTRAKDLAGRIRERSEAPK